MAHAATKYLPTLTDQERDEVGHELQATLLELIDLSLIGKQLHWTVVGPLFLPLHLYTEELVSSWRALSDMVAERAVAIGFLPNGQARIIAADSPLTPVERGAVQDYVAVRELNRRVAEVSDHVRIRMDTLGEFDVPTQDLLISIVRVLEEQQWMLRAQFGIHVTPSPGSPHGAGDLSGKLITASYGVPRY